MGCVGSCTVPVTASASVVECAIVNAVMMVTMSRATCGRPVGALPLAVDRPQHRGQQQQQHERDVVVADRARATRLRRRSARSCAHAEACARLGPRRRGGTEHAGELLVAARRAQQHALRCVAAHEERAAYGQQARAADSRPATPRTGNSARLRWRARDRAPRARRARRRAAATSWPSTAALDAPAARPAPPAR